MSYEEVIFYVVGAVTVAAAGGVVFSRNVVHAALFLMLALFATAGVFVIALFVLFTNLVVDLLYVYLDPRIRFD